MRAWDWSCVRERTFITIVCLQAAFLVPYVVLVPDERTNVFTSLLALLPFIQALLARLYLRLAGIPWRTVLAWALLVAGLAVSSMASATPFPSALRALSFVAPAIGGLVGSHEFLHTESARDYLFDLLTLCFAGLALSHLLLGAQPSFLGLHHHALAGTLVLLSAGPIRMAGQTGGLRKAIAWTLLMAGATVCFLAGSRFVVLLPFVLIPIYTVFRSMPRRVVAIALCVSLAVAGSFFAVFPKKIPKAVNYESTFYRIEAFPATWEILKEHSFLGIGIRTPRVAYLQNYKPQSGLVGRPRFLAVVDRNVTWDNQYLSLLCGVGVPLTLLYLWLAGRLVRTYLRRAWSKEVDHATERALTFALLASILHFAVHDGLFYPQINWLFHLLLGVGAFSLFSAAPRAGEASSGPAAPTG